MLKINQNIKRFILLGYVSVLGLIFCYAQYTTVPSLSVSSLEEAWEYARKHNPTLEQYRLQQEKAQADYKVTRSYQRVQISANFSWQNNTSLATTPLPGEIFGQPNETVNAQFGQKYNYNAGITISKTLFDRKLKLQRQLSQQNALLISQQNQVFEQTLREQVALFYYTALVAERALQISEQDLQLADSLASISQLKLKEGAIDQLAMNQALINRNNVTQSIIQYQSLIAQCKQELSILWGLDPATELSFEEEISNEIPGMIMSAGLQPDAALRLSEAELEQAEVKIKYEKAAYLPTLTGNTYWGKQQFRDNFGIEFGDDNWTDYSYIAFSLNIPIFNGFGTKNKVKAAEIERDIAMKEYEELERTSRIGDEYLMEEYRRSWTTLKAVHDNYRLFESSNKLTSQKYEEGIIGLDASLKAFEDYLQAENNYLNSLSNLYGYYASIIARN